MKVLLIQQKKQPVAIEIEDSLKAMQAVVHGYIQVVYPWQDEVGLVCNEEGKLQGMPLNRPLFREDGQLIDIIVGDFFICSAPSDSDSFASLSDEQIEKYTKLFSFPVNFN